MIVVVVVVVIGIRWNGPRVYLCFTYASSILSLFSGYSLLSCARFGTWTRGESQHRYTSSRVFVRHRIRCFTKSFIHDFGSSIFSSHCCHYHTCVLAYRAPALQAARKVGRHCAVRCRGHSKCFCLRMSQSQKWLLSQHAPAANVASVTLFASYTTVTEQYTVMDHATIHVQVLISQ